MFVGYVDKSGYGYTFDGKRIGRKLCDEGGEPVTREGEKVIGCIKVKYEVSVGSFLLNPLLYSYEGNFYRTNHRLIGVREPKAWEGVMRKGFELPTPGGIADAWRTKEVAKAGGKEYFELALNEIIKNEEGRGYILIQAPAEKKKKYWLTLLPSKVQRETLHNLLSAILPPDIG